eukprot:TRINITY_DN14431_c0_g1_i1.p1 TRINITY_DN14431_c0_g1~~TRINITY_DN14431_c0_g1_i1.p1  ORF type:complete len:1368 (-),score=400.24 TRINITY_DN14431_c0_g1_i1:120-4223(-)
MYSTPAGEVRALTKQVDIKVSSTNHSRLEALALRRKEKHDAAMLAFELALTSLATTMETHAEDASDAVTQRLQASESETEELFNQMEQRRIDPEQAQQWLQEQPPQRNQWIVAFEQDLQWVEQQRVTRAAAETETLRKKLVDIAFMLPDEIQPILDDRSRIFADSAAANRQRHGDRIQKLFELERARTEKVAMRWTQLRIKLSKEKYEKIAANARAVVKSDKWTFPDSRRALLDNLRADQATAIRERTQALTALSACCPPALTVANVQAASHHLNVVLDRMQNVTSHYTHSLRNDETRWVEKRAAFLEQTRNELIAQNVVDADVVSVQIDAELEPIAYRLHHKATDLVETCIEALQAQRKQTRAACTGLQAFFLRTAQFMEQHERECAELDETTRAAMLARRAAADEQVILLEQKLTEQLDALRQSKDAKAVEAELAAALAVLDEIEAAYRSFHDESVGISKNHITQLQALTTGYDKHCGEVFAVELDVPRVEPVAPVEPPPVVASVKSGAAAKKGPTPEPKKPVAGSKLAAKPSAGGRTSPQPPQPTQPTVTSPVPTAPKVDDDLTLLRTEKGTWFRIIKPDAWEEAEQSAPPADLTVPSKVPLDPWGKPVLMVDALPRVVMRSFANTMRRMMLNNNEKRADERLRDANEQLKQHEDQLAKELDDRLKAHRPRKGRVELDVAEARVSELKTHAWRVERHLQTVHQRGVAAMSAFDSSVLEVEDRLAKYNTQQQQLAAAMKHGASSETVKAICRQAEALRDSFVKQTKERTEALAQSAVKHRDHVETSNRDLAQTFSDFATGGKFHAEEIERMQTAMGKKLSQSDTETQAASTRANELFAKCETAANAACTAALEESKAHLVDLQFIEALRGKSTLQPSYALEENNDNGKANDVETQIDELELLTADTQPLNADNTLFIRILLALRLLRASMFRRAKRLKMLKSNLAVTDITVPGDASVDDSRQDVPLPFMDRVQQLVDKERTSYFEFAEAYYKSKGDRPPTREVIPKTLADFKLLHEDRFKAALHKADNHVTDAVARYRSQVARVSHLLPTLATPLYTSLTARAIDIIRIQTTQLLVVFDQRLKQLAADAKANTAKLKVVLGGPLGVQLLEQLNGDESRRFADTIALIKQNCRDLTLAEAEKAGAYAQLLVDITTVFSKLLDETITPPDLSAPAAPVEGKHKSLKRLMKDRTRVASQTPTGTAAAGAAYAIRTFPGVSLKDMTIQAVFPEFASVVAPIAPTPTPEPKVETKPSGKAGAPAKPAAPAKAPSTGKAPAKPVAAKGGKATEPVEAEAAPPGMSSDIQCSDTLAHLAMIKARDRGHAQYLQQFHAAVKRYKVEEEAEIKEQQRYKDRWDAMVEQLTAEGK